MSMAQRAAGEVSAILADHGGAVEYAFVECAASGCRRTKRYDYSEGVSDAELTRRFEDQGWTVSPTRCPEHIGRKDGDRERP